MPSVAKAKSSNIAIARKSSIADIDGLPSNVTLRRRVQKMLDAIQMSNAELSILLTDDREIRKLNRTFRGIDRPTDVLSFSLREGEHADLAGDLLGDLVISATTLRRQARQAKRPMLDEATMLLAHGLLHLLGWDHQTPGDDKKMRRETDRLCVAAGGHPLFALGGVDAEGVSRPTKQAAGSVRRPAGR